MAPAPKYFLILARAGHLAWTDVRADFHKKIIAYAVPFLDHYVRGTPPTDLLKEGDAELAAYRYNTEFGFKP
jgi:hypothetical protein